jgi:adenine/guanine phosphoribosyltransferase-like PRPP-binding protein
MKGSRAALRIRDLKSRNHKSRERPLSVGIPASTATAIDDLAKRLNASKTDVVVALLNEALAVATEKLRCQ